jgi:hydroxypyruvate isomerase
MQSGEMLTAPGLHPGYKKEERTMPRFAANLSMLFTEVDFLERFAAAADAGFTGVEYLFPYDFAAETIKARLDAHKLEQVLFNLPAGDWSKGERGIACHPDRVEEFRAGVDQAIAYAKVLGNSQINCLAGIRQPGHDCAAVEQCFVDNLRFAAEKLQAAGIKLVMEMINTRDIPGFYLNNTQQALAIRKQVGSSNLYLQYDIYHMQIMEGDLARTVEANLAVINHVQLADNPGRNEPGTGEINYRFLFEHLDRIGYQGWIGCEYKPATTTAAGLGWMAHHQNSMHNAI